jgi:pyridoxine 5-phosphate synthase
MAVTDEMRDIALRYSPHAACLVPEKREERTTEGGLNVVKGHNTIAPVVQTLREAGIRVSLFIEADPDQIATAASMGAQVVELHTGAFCDALREGQADQADRLLQTLRDGAALAADLGLEVHAGHGIDYETVTALAAIPQVVELNIGHFLIGEAIFVGLEQAMAKMRSLMQAARAIS